MRPNNPTAWRRALEAVAVGVAVTSSLLGVSVARAGTVLVSQIRTTVDTAADVVDFQITYTGGTPDFFSTDSLGRQADGFQFSTSAIGADYQKYSDRNVLIRGGEIHFGGGLPIRNAQGFDPNISHSGGWGFILGTVPFTLSGEILTFSASFSLLNAPNGAFQYFFESGPFGGDNQFFYGTSGGLAIPGVPPSPTTTPIPTGLPLFAAGLCMIGLLLGRLGRRGAVVAMAAA